MTRIVPETVEGSVPRVEKALSQVDPARRSAAEAKAVLMPKTARGNHFSAVAGKASPRSAIKAFCLECVGWNRCEVARCTALACPLYAYRPFKEV